MTDPSRPRPVPGPPRPGLGGAPVTGAVRPAGPAAVPPAAAGPVGVGPAGAESAGAEPAGAGPDAGALAGLDRRPVAEHVAVFEAEHGRLQRELATIDQL